MKTLNEFETRVFFLIDYTSSIFLLILGSHLGGPGVKKTQQNVSSFAIYTHGASGNKKSQMSASTKAPSKKRTSQNLLFYLSNIWSLACIQRRPAGNAGLSTFLHQSDITPFHGFLIIGVLAVFLISNDFPHSPPSSILSDLSPLPWTKFFLFLVLCTCCFLTHLHSSSQVTYLPLVLKVLAWMSLY